MPDKSVLIVGVGGQGTLLASRLLGAVAIEKGYDVKVSEVHGMSQRGGSVVTYVRFSSEKVHSPLIDEGEADIIMAFEPLEALRSVQYVKKDGWMLVNKHRINPMPVITGAAQYPDGIIETIKGLGINLTAVDATLMAANAGSEKAVNTVLIGMLAARSEIEKSVWEAALSAIIPEKHLEVNKKAFNAGYNM